MVKAPEYALEPNEPVDNAALAAAPNWAGQAAHGRRHLVGASVASLAVLASAERLVRIGMSG